MTPKIVCVAGPTACGKTTLGVLLAQRFHGEVVSADSMQIYRGMTVGTAAPTEAEMQGGPPPHDRRGGAQRTVERRRIRGEGHAHRG